MINIYGDKNIISVNSKHINESNKKISQKQDLADVLEWLHAEMQFYNRMYNETNAMYETEKEIFDKTRHYYSDEEIYAACLKDRFAGIDMALSNERYKSEWNKISRKLNVARMASDKYWKLHKIEEQIQNALKNDGKKERINNMFREDNSTFYRPDSGNTNHSDALKRQPKKKELLADKRCQLAATKMQLHCLDERQKNKNAGLSTNEKARQKIEKQIGKLEREIAAIESQDIVHKSIHTQRKMNSDKIFESCKQILKDSIEHNINFVTAEDVAYQLNTPVYLVKQCFAKMNKMGLLSQPQHNLPHDCFRPHCSGWAGNIYYIQPNAK